MGVLQGAHRNDRLIGLVHVKEAERANPRGPKGTVELQQSGGGGGGGWCCGTGCEGSEARPGEAGPLGQLLKLWGF